MLTGRNHGSIVPLGTIAFFVTLLATAASASPIPDPGVPLRGCEL